VRSVLVGNKRLNVSRRSLSLLLPVREPRPRSAGKCPCLRVIRWTFRERAGLLPITFYEPDFSALQDVPARIVVGGGTTSEGQFAQRTAAALAERLGTALIQFPGDHNGFGSDAQDFAVVLRRSLQPGTGTGPEQ
jgi:hypothetical protein